MLHLYVHVVHTFCSLWTSDFRINRSSAFRTSFGILKSSAVIHAPSPDIRMAFHMSDTVRMQPKVCTGARKPEQDTLNPCSSHASNVKSPEAFTISHVAVLKFKGIMVLQLLTTSEVSGNTVRAAPVSKVILTQPTSSRVFERARCESSRFLLEFLSLLFSF